MTCIVGIVDDGEVLIAGDSAGVAGTSLAIRADHKVFRNGEVIIGITSSFRMGQILRYNLSVPDLAEGQDLDHYMVTTFIEAVRKAFADGGFTSFNDGKEVGGQFLVGIRGRLFEVDSDFQVGEQICGFAAVGCGFELALGAISALENTNFDAIEKLKIALDSAEQFSGGVRRPFVYGSTSRAVSEF